MHDDGKTAARRTQLRPTILCIIAVALTACGGGGGSNGPAATSTGGGGSILPLACPLFFIFLGDLCIEDPNNLPPDSSFTRAGFRS